jgi:hypothetical protein
MAAPVNWRNRPDQQPRTPAHFGEGDLLLLIFTGHYPSQGLTTLSAAMIVANTIGHHQADKNNPSPESSVLGFRSCLRLFDKPGSICASSSYAYRYQL